VRYKSLYYVVFFSFLILKIVVSWVESVKIPASKMAAIKQSPELVFVVVLRGEKSIPGID
jgi:hypothetical protein